jgi:hypothetical protein
VIRSASRLNRSMLQAWCTGLEDRRPGSLAFPRSILDRNGFKVLVLEAEVVIGGLTRLERTRDSSLADNPSSLFSGNLGVLSVIFIGILNWGHTVNSRRALELNALVCGAWSDRRVLLEDALRRARVDIRVAWNLQRRETLGCWAHGRNWRTRSNG